MENQESHELLEDKAFWDEMREKLAGKLKELEERDAESGIQHPSADDYLDFYKARIYPDAVTMDNAKADQIVEHVTHCNDCAKLFPELKLKHKLSENEKDELNERRDEVREMLSKKMQEFEGRNVEFGEHATADELLSFASPGGYPGIERLSLKRTEEIAEHLKHCDECYVAFRALDNMEADLEMARKEFSRRPEEN